MTHPDVGDAAVVGRPDERRGEVPIAFVVANEDLDVAGLQAWVADQVVEYKHLAAIEIVSEIPKNPSGKILRRVLRDSLQVPAPT